VALAADIMSRPPEPLTTAEVAVADRDIVIEAKLSFQRAPVTSDKGTLAGMVVTITAHQKAHTTAVVVVVAQEHKDIIVADDMDKPEAVKVKLAVLPDQLCGVPAVELVEHILFQFLTVQQAWAAKAVAVLAG
jgi:hypothetical protein